MKHSTFSWGNQVCSRIGENMISSAMRIAILVVSFFVWGTGNAGATNPPANDLCSGAIDIGCNEVYLGSTEWATTEDVDLCHPWIVAGEPGVWFTHVGTGNTIRLRLNERENPGEWDTFLSVYTGTCDDLTCVVSDDDSGPGLNSFASFYAEVGVTYYFYATGYDTDGEADGDSGPFRFRLRCMNDCVPSLDMACASDVTVECGQENNLELTGSPVVDLNTCEVDVDATVTYTDIVLSDNGCAKLISRTWVAVYGDLTATCTQLISTVDTTSPVISGVEPVVSVECLESVPGPADATAMDACSGSAVVSSFTSNTGELISHCDLSTAFGPGQDWAIWLPSLYDLGYAASTQFNFVGNGGFDQFNDGTAHLYGTIANSINGNQQFVVDFWFENAADWATWSSMGRSYKDDLNCATPSSLFEDWTYYEMVNDFSSLTGLGDYAGDVLYFQHMPANYYFGMQVGQGANNKNCNFGLSTWFTFNGFMDGQYVSGHGDANTDASCEPNNEQDCANSTSFTYLYRAQDACGHASIVSQTILVNDETAPTFDNCPESLTIECSDAIPAVASPSATDNCVGDVVVSFLGEVAEGNECYSSITRTWMAEDICGNRSYCEQVITIVDTTAPVFNNLPAEEITVECSEVTEAAELTATDNCAASVQVMFEESTTPGECAGQYTINRHWWVADNCQNVAHFYQTVNVIDTTAPVFDEYVYYDHIECDQIPAVITATDNCGSVTVVVTLEEHNSGGCLGVLHRIYTATDDCGNSATAEQYISIQDHTAPSIVGIGDDYTAECSEVAMIDGFYFGSGDVYGVDNCGGDVTIEYAEEVVSTDDNCPQSYDIIRIWTATDYCENQTIDSMVVHVVDTTAPVIEVNTEDMYVSCDQEVPAPNAVAFDNCGETTLTSNDVIVPGACDQAYTIERTYTAEDECGNISSVTVYIHIYDETAPVFGEDNVYQMTVECSDEIPYVEPSATDNCGEVTITYADMDYMVGECYSIVLRTFTATDECGNSSNFYQYISIVDTTAPVFDAYEMEINLPCDNYEGTFVTATDNCNEVTINYVDEFVSGGCAGRIIREYTATDACGNAASTQQIITLTDVTAPVATFSPESFEVECGQPYEMANPVFEDNCDDELVLTANVTTEFDGCTTIVSYIWTATDHCQNATTVTATVTIVDTTNPEWEYVPADLNISCDQEVPAAEEAIAFDNCDEEVEVAMTQDTLAGSCPANMTIRRLYRAFDNCGNEIMAIQNINISDNNAPVWNEENVYELTFECTDVVAGVEPTATDNCSEFTIAVAETLYVQGPCYTSGAFIYTATDACGNVSAPFYQYFQILDTTAPVITGEFEITKPCDDYEGVFISYEDNCNEVSVDYSDEHVSGGCQGRIIRTYYVSDACQNMSTFQQYITLTDEVAPVVTYQTADAQFECGSEYPTPVVEFADNCAEELTYASSVSSEGTCPEVITYTFSATDNCDNTTTVNVVYTIVDTTAPMVYAPQGGQFSCDEEIMYGMAEAWDACSDVVVTYSDETYDGECPAAYSIVRTWMAEDACGNIGYGYTTYNVVDLEAPIFEMVGESVTIECDEEVPAAEWVVTDNCSTYDVTVNEMPYSYECFEVIEREYVAVDACGNTSYAYQTISIVDTTAPVVVGTVEIERPCTDYMGTYIEATDNCNTFEIEFVDEHVSGGCQGRIIRDYTVTDLCGNASTFQQIITLTDEIAPVAEVLPEDLVIECTEEVPGFIPMWSDNCDDELELTAISSIALDGCTEYISRSWTATDNCGNSTTISQMITIVDTQAPMFDGDGYSMTVNCDEEWSVETPSAWDACHDVTVAEDVETIAGNCEASYTEVHTFIATDECGNESAPFVVTVNVVDNTAPYWTFVPSSNEISCDAEIPSMMATASDACSEVTVTSSDEIIAGNCPSAYTLVRTFYAEDACGNEAEPVSVSYYIYDNQAPVIETELVDIYVECPMEIVPAEIAVSDNCSEVSIDPSVEQVTSDDCGNGQWVVSYYVVDACGNATTASYSVYVNDVTAPVLSETPANLVLSCEEALPVAPEVTAMDNCNGEVEVMYTETYVGEQPEEGSIADCDLLTPALPAGNSCGYPTAWAMVMFNMPSAHRYYAVQSAELVQFANGTAHLIGSLVNVNNANAGFNVDVWFNNGMDWASWSNQNFPTGFKADCGGEAANHEDWFYYLLVNGDGAELTGWGQYAGSAINLSHAPSSNYFGFQLGDGANNYNGADNGFGGWFSYNGTFINATSNTSEPAVITVNGGGDFAFELDCCPDYSVVRCWTSMDCSGNVVEYCQTISWEGSSNNGGSIQPVEPISSVEAAKEAMLAVYPNPAVDQATFVFKAAETGKSTIEIYDLAGSRVAMIYQNVVEAGNEYKTTYDASNLATGVYMYRMTNGNTTEMGRLIINK